ncbi:N-acetylmuramoyl-L-alanine amidase family protein [Phascolarctobacterium faecium]|uniref:N-acetylmuramoyl-L-alanine amidase family protein n=1 Tax=Phascolarctobacterium faecium TaxID=33025 RepID=UPI00210BC845|nr:N-acetylmuramoyl-L-alanine amidase [Phascolarctobacterium faecium]
MLKKLVFVFALVSCLMFSLTAFASEITDVRWGIDKTNVLRLVVDCDKPTGYKITFDGNTMLITMDADLNSKVGRAHKIKSDIANEMRLDTSEGKTVLKVPLQKAIGSKDYKGFTLKKDPVTKRPDRIVIDVMANKRQASEPAKTTPAGGKTTTDKTPTPAVSKTAYRTSGGLKDKRITLDAGHGGSDPGAVGAKGTKEKDITLKITQKVEELLKKKGAKVTMTRVKDVDVYGVNATDAQELQARVDVAENSAADLFISLHINASVNKNVGGFSSYYYPKTSHDARVAAAIQKRMTNNFGLDDLGIRQANFYVNKRSSMPSALIEMAFITNAKEEKLLNSNWFQSKLAKAIADGIEDYFK